LSLGLFAPVVSAKVYEAKVPLKDGKVHLQTLAGAVCAGLGKQPEGTPQGDLDVSGDNGATFVAAINQALGDGCHVKMGKDAVVIRVDTEKLPKDCDSVQRAVRLFAAVEASEAAAAQGRSFQYGLNLPSPLDASQPLVVLVHGVDSSCAMWGSMSDLLREAGYQVATFGYPADGPVEDAAASLARDFCDFHRKHPRAQVDIVGYSMGGLVARAFIEGPDYAGGVDRLILCGTPNAGSSWARYRLALELREHYHLWRTDPNWKPVWMITDGLGEAGRDLKPGSEFLKTLNARPRREGVRYTVVAGNRHAATSTCADWWECSARTLFPGRVGTWWGFRQCREKMFDAAREKRLQTGDSDGPVTVESARLAGVSDVVILPADHSTLCVRVGAEGPVAWDVIRERLAH
jgi:pimeloyl-ACP methyl ester carboxylesterase